MSQKIMFSLLLALITVPAFTQQGNYLHETKSEKDARMQWWRDAKFGMFIHWGLYAVPAGEYNGKTSYGEWIMNEANIPVQEYEKFAGLFNPVRFNADEWVSMAKNAGMKYIVITSKHHDGFSMFDSNTSDYDITDSTPFGKDVMKALEASCKKYDIRLCFYHSIMDWHHPDARGAGFPSYRENYLKPQLKELLTNYGNIGVLWFDGEWIDEWTEEQGKDLYNYVRGLQPDIIINNRVGKGRAGMQGMNEYDHAAGDFGTPEQEILLSHSDYDWESCMTMNDHWGFNKFDKNFKPADDLIWNLADCAAKGGNYLLNVGPTPEGTFPQESIDRLKEIGDWMNVNNMAVSGSRAWKVYEDGKDIRYTQGKDGYVYIFVRHWPGKPFMLKYLVPAHGKLRLLGTQLSFRCKPTADGTLVEINTPSPPAGLKYTYVFRAKGDMANVTPSPEIDPGKSHPNNMIIFDGKYTARLNSPEHSTVYFTLDGSTPSAASLKYISPITVEKSCILKAIALRDKEISSRIATMEFVKSKFSIDITPEPSPKYAGSGALTLADGISGSTWYGDNHWLGFSGDDVTAVINLGSSRVLKNVIVSYLSQVRSWIFPPLSVEVYTSADGIQYQPAGVKHLQPLTQEVPEEHCRVSVPVNCSAQYLKIKVKNTGICPEWHPGRNLNCWLFLDEVIVE